MADEVPGILEDAIDGPPSLIDQLPRGSGVSPIVASPDELREASRLSALLESELRTFVDEPGRFAGLSGSGKVDKALDEFLSNWTYGVEQNAEALDRMALGLLEAARAYEQADGAIRDAACGT